MTTRERHAVVTHTIGSGGTLSIRTIRGSVRIRGTDGDEARVEARYAHRNLGSTGPDEDKTLKVERLTGELRVEADETSRGLRPGLGMLLRGGVPAVDFDITMPRTALLRLSGVSADLDVRDLRGAQEIHTVSGDISMDDVSGGITVQSVSGNVLIRGSVIALDGTTTSGDLSAGAERIESVRARSVSGDLRLSGLLAASGEHAIESISGDLELAPSGGVTVRMTGISGSVHSELPHRRESNGGRRSIVVGDGAATVTFRTMSGDLNLMRMPGSGAPEQPVSLRSPMRPPDPPDELAILRALERGEIDVDEAARRLEGARTNG